MPDEREIRNDHTSPVRATVACIRCGSVLTIAGDAVQLAAAFLCRQCSRRNRFALVHHDLPPPKAPLLDIER